MKKRWMIYVILIVLINLISAKTIYVSYPESVENGKEFNLNLKLKDFDNINYDVKIDILDGENRISKIFVEEKWKSTFYWIKEAIKKETEFQMKTQNGNGEYEMSIKIRNGEEIFHGECEITVGSLNGKIEECKIKFDEEKEEEKEEEKLEKEIIEEEVKVENIEPKINETVQQIPIIKLGGTKEPKIIYESGVEKIKKYSILAFGLVSVIAGLIILKNDR